MQRLTNKRTWEEAKDDLAAEYGYSHIWQRLNAIENILGDDYDLDRLRVLVDANFEKRVQIEPALKNENPNRLCVSVAEAARLCGVSRPTMNNWTHIEGFPCARIGGRVLIPVAGLERWLDHQANQSDAAPAEKQVTGGSNYD